MLEDISPIDGRYREQVEEIREIFSEYCLIKNRIIIEIEWLKKIFLILKINYNREEIKILNKIIEEFDIKEAKKVKEIENITKHDVKAVEYYLDEKFKENNIEKYNQFIHFACTSEDINNLAYGIMIKNLKEQVYIKNCEYLIKNLKEKAKENAEVPMLSHTHGQNATPTTIGKEIAVCVYRLNKILEKVKLQEISGKFNGKLKNIKWFFNNVY